MAHHSRPAHYWPSGAGGRMSLWTPEKKDARARVRAQIYQLIADSPGIASSTIAELLAMPIMTVAGHLSFLTREGRVIVKRGARATGRRPRGATRAYPTDSPVPRVVNKGGAGHTTPMPYDPEHRAWMDYWNARSRTGKQWRAAIMAMRGRV